MQQLRYAARRLRQSPGFAVTAVLVLAIAIGFNTAVFSVVDALVLRPLPFPQPDRIVAVNERLTSFGDVGASYANYLDWRAEAKTLGATSLLNRENVTLISGDSAERLPALRVSAGFFDVVRTYPVLGRAFRADEDRKQSAGRAVISDSLWRRRFGADPRIVGRSIELQNKPFTIVGVLPASFAFPLSKFDLLIPYGPETDLQRGNHQGIAIARVKAGIPIKQADAELHAIGERLARAYPQDDRGWSLSVIPLGHFLTKNFRTAMLMLLGAVGLVLLIACVNLAGLMLVRAAARRGETAIRTALGGGTWAIMRETLSEAAILVVSGSTSGILLGWWGVSVLVSFVPADMALPQIAFDTRLFLFAVGTTGFCTLLFGVVPALRTLRSDPQEALGERGRSNTQTMQGHRLRGALVMAQTALALVLALGAGLVIKSFTRLVHVDPGFTAGRPVTMRIELNGPAYENDASSLFWNRLLHGLGAQPAIAKAGLVSFLPMTENDTQVGYYIEGRPKPKSLSEIRFADRFTIGGDYLETLGIQLLRGRSFQQTDGLHNPLVILIDDEFARRNFGSDDPLKHRVIHDERAWQIVGVVRHVKAYGLDDTQTREQFYFHYPQFAWSAMTLAVNPTVDRASAVDAVRQAARAIDRGIPIAEIRPMDDWLKESTWRDRLSTSLLALFAIVALILAGLGIYGVMAYAAGQRKQEIGIRLALGATPRVVLGMMLREASVLSGAGIVTGALLAFPLVGLLKAILFQVSPQDAGVFGVAALVLAIVCSIAGLVPALRASRTDPMTVMRYE